MRLPEWSKPGKCAPSEDVRTIFLRDGMAQDLRTFRYTFVSVDSVLPAIGTRLRLETRIFVATIQSAERQNTARKSSNPFTVFHAWSGSDIVKLLDLLLDRLSSGRCEQRRLKRGF